MVFRKWISIILFLILLTTVYTYSNSQYTDKSSVLRGNDKNKLNDGKFLIENNVTMPFNGLEFEYDISIVYSDITIPKIDLLVNYTNFNDIINNETVSENYDYIQNLKFSSWLISLIGLTSENVTFYENSTSRKISLHKLEGVYLTGYIEGYSAYNLSGDNWTPFWINPTEALESSNYGIYSFVMQYNKTLVLPEGALPMFNKPRPVIIYNNNIDIKDGNSSFKHSIGLIYDNITGILLKGTINSIFENTTHYITYDVEMDLHSSNVFDAILKSTSSSSIISDSSKEEVLIGITLPPPNYLLLEILIISPLAVVAYRILNLKEIDGGSG